MPLSAKAKKDEVKVEEVVTGDKLTRRFVVTGPETMSPMQAMTAEGIPQPNDCYKCPQCGAHHLEAAVTHVRCWPDGDVEWDAGRYVVEVCYDECVPLTPEQP